jgi:hypothetical protein
LELKMHQVSVFHADGMFHAFGLVCTCNHEIDRLPNVRV